MEELNEGSTNTINRKRKQERKKEILKPVWFDIDRSSAKLSCKLFWTNNFSYRQV
jgi:hypothetical protein